MSKKKVRKSTTIDMVTAPPARDPNMKKGDSKGQDKVKIVMDEFKAGKLKSSSGKTVTDKDQALAIALSAAGLSRKSLEKAEILNKIRVLKAQAQRLLYKELAKDESIEGQLIEYFKTHKNPNDSEVHALAEKLNISPHDLEGKIYSILSSFLAGGLSGGKEKPVDEKELEMGIAVEVEHTDNPELARKIATDHLTEQNDYYTRLKEMESKPIKKARSVGGYESPEPGDIPENKKKVLAEVYAKCRKDGGDKEKCSKIAWSAVNRIK